MTTFDFHAGPVSCVDMRPDGTPGEVVVTGLSNFVQPFIRYRLGDVAVRSAGPACACGRALPVLELGEGRADDVFVPRRPAHPSLVGHGPLPLAREGASLIDAARARGRLRVGFVPGQAPYSHFNARGELVGFDVEMALALGRELGAPLEFAPVARDQLVEVLEAGRVDVVMAGILVTTRRAARVVFSEPYLDETLAFLVPDHRRAEFSDAAAVRARDGLRLGVPDLPYIAQIVEREFPKATIVPMPLNDPEAPLAGRINSVDAINNFYGE